MITTKKNLRSGDPLWLSYKSPTIPTEELLSNQKVDVVIIGAGISGAMMAEELSEAGFSIIMLDRRGPLKGATSATTALLQYEIDEPLSKLSTRIGLDKSMRAWRRSKLALESLAAKIQGLNIKCDFNRRDSLYLAGNILDAEDLKKEQEIRTQIGLYCKYLSRKELLKTFNIKSAAALKSFDNLSVNPKCLAANLILKAIEKGTKVYAPVNVTNVESLKTKVIVHTSFGHEISAKHVVFATGYEMPKFINTKRHKIISTWAIATKPQPAKLWPEECLIWEASDPYLYLRTTPDCRVICGGEDEEFADAEKRDAMTEKKTATLEKKLGKLFPQLDSKADFAWTGSFGTSTTGLPSIGQIPGMKNCFAVMAYGGNGITFSRIGAELIRAKLTGKDDPEEDIFKFS